MLSRQLPLPSKILPTSTPATLCIVKIKLSVFALNVAYVVKRAKNVKLDRCDHGQVTDASAAILSLIDQLVANMVAKKFHNSGMKYGRLRIPNVPKFITPDISIFVNL